MTFGEEIAGLKVSIAKCGRCRTADLRLDSEKPLPFPENSKGSACLSIYPRMALPKYAKLRFCPNLSARLGIDSNAQFGEKLGKRWQMWSK